MIYCAQLRIATEEGECMIPENTSTYVIIDTDMAPDDWMAILYRCRPLWWK